MRTMISVQHDSEHLSEEALDDLLIGLGSVEAEAHLAACSRCSDTLRQFQAKMGNFNQASLAWSEDRPVPQAMRKAIARLNAKPHGAIAPLRWAVAVAVVAALGFQIWTYEFQRRSTPPVASVSPSVDSEVQIAQDNQLLQSVNAALKASDVLPASEYGLQAELSSELKPHTWQGNKVVAR
jgi:anti-sigma factor RsiW